MTTQQIKEKAREEFRQYFGSRCIKHPDCFPDECGCLFDFIDSTIDSAISQAVKEREEEIIEILGKILNSEIMSKLKPLLNNLIKSKNE